MVDETGQADEVRVLTRLSVYKSRLLIYDAGDARTTWVSFWKAMALLQFGTTLVFAVPPLWNNENQPDPRLRKAQAILGKTIYFIFLLSLFSCPVFAAAHPISPSYISASPCSPPICQSARQASFHVVESSDTSLFWTTSTYHLFHHISIFVHIAPHAQAPHPRGY